MAKYRVYWADNDAADRGYYADVDAADESHAAFLAAFNAQPGAAFGGISALDPPQQPLQ